LRHEGLRVESQRPYPIWYCEQPVGECIPDLTVNGTVLVDAKSIDGLGENEQAQMLNYLRISGRSIGLVINFKNQKLEWKRIVQSKG
jgi:GxxExxY protein